jgi:hypothetical protein
MASESANVDLVRLGLEAYEREGPDALLSRADPEIEIFIEPGLANAGTYHGHDGLRRSAAEWLEAWRKCTRFHAYAETGRAVAAAKDLAQSG